MNGHAVSELGRLLASFGGQPAPGIASGTAFGATSAQSGPLTPGAAAYSQMGGAPPAHAATPAPYVASGSFTPGPYTSGPSSSFSPRTAR